MLGHCQGAEKGLIIVVNRERHGRGQRKVAGHTNEIQDSYSGFQNRIHGFFSLFRNSQLVSKQIFKNNHDEVSSITMLILQKRKA